MRPAPPSVRDSVSLHPCTFPLAVAPLPPFIPWQGVLMVLMNLGVVALPIMELGRFFLDPLRALMQRCGVLRGDISTASVGEPADAPADAEVEISEVLRLPTWLNIWTHCSSRSSSGRVPFATRLPLNATVLLHPPHSCSRANAVSR